jgi:hypothetical protein
MKKKPTKFEIVVEKFSEEHYRCQYKTNGKDDISKTDLVWLTNSIRGKMGDGIAEASSRQK